jgi:hypothetical protein
MSPIRHYTEADLAQLVKNRDRDYIERVRGSTDARRTTVKNGSSREAAIQQTKSRRGESAPSPYRSKWEEQMAYELLLEKRTDGIRDWGYETMTLKLGTKHYHRPDFTVWHHDGRIELRQVKGFHKNIRASLVALRWAAQTHPWFTFTLWRRDGQRWESSKVEI